MALRSAIHMFMSMEDDAKGSSSLQVKDRGVPSVTSAGRGRTSGRPGARRQGQAEGLAQHGAGEHVVERALGHDPPVAQHEARG